MGPRLTAEQRDLRRRRDVDEPDERERDPDHDAGQHAGREDGDDRRRRHPEVEGLDPAQAPQLGDVDHPEDDRVDDDRAEHRLRQVREQRRERDEGQDDERAGDERRERRAGAGRLVERAGGQARRDRHPAERACRDVGHALRDRLLIDVDAVAVPRSERPGVAGGLREADQEQPGGGGEDRRVVLREDVEVRQAPAWAGRAAPRRRARHRGRRGRTAASRGALRPPARGHPARAGPRSAARGSPPAPPRPPPASSR